MTVTHNSLSAPILKLLAKALLLAVVFVGFSSHAALAQDDQEYKRAYNAGLEAYKAKNNTEAYTQWSRAATLAQQAGDADIARKASYYVTQLDYKNGLSAINSEDFDGALDSFQKGIDRYPDYAKNYLGRGLALKKLGQTEEAMDAFVQTMEVGQRVNDRETARKAEDAIRENYLYLASSTLSANGVRPTSSAADQAIGYLNQLAERLEHDASSLYYMAVAYDAKGDSDQLISYANQALEARPSRSDAALIHLLLGEMYLNQGNISESRNHLQQATFGNAKARAEALLGQIAGTQ